MAFNINVFYRLIKNKISIYKNGPVPGDELARVFKQLGSAIAEGGSGTVEAENGLNVNPTTGKVELGGVFTKATFIGSTASDNFSPAIGIIPGVVLFIQKRNTDFPTSVASINVGNGGATIGVNEGSSGAFITVSRDGILGEDRIHERGFEESADYSLNKRPLGLVTKQMLTGSGTHVKDGKIGVGVNLATLGDTNEGFIQDFLGFFTNGGKTGADHTSLQMTDGLFQIYRHKGGLEQSIVIGPPGNEDLMRVEDGLLQRGLGEAADYSANKQPLDYATLKMLNEAAPNYIDSATSFVTADGVLTTYDFEDGSTEFDALIEARINSFIPHYFLTHTTVEDSSTVPLGLIRVVFQTPPPVDYRLGLTFSYLKPKFPGV